MACMSPRFNNPFETQTFFTIGAITGLSIVVFGATFVHAVWYAPAGELANMDDPNSSMIVVPESARANKYSFDSSAAAASSSVLSSTYPSRLIIPAVNINASVQRVGIARSGAMGVPSNFTDVAWYRYGTVPGQIGSAVIDGHVDNGLGLDGVFKHLSDVQVGDEVDVKTVGGRTLVFKITNLSYFDYKSVPADALFGPTDDAELKIITCSGSWVQSDKTYNKRLVVTAIYGGSM